MVWAGSTAPIAAVVNVLCVLNPDRRDFPRRFLLHRKILCKKPPWCASNKCRYVKSCMERKGVCAHGQENGCRAEDAVRRPTDTESVAAAYGVLWYNLTVLSGRMNSPIPIDRKRCKAIVCRNVGSFSPAILMQRSAHTPARLSSYFGQGILQPLQRSERGRFFFPMVAMTASFG